MQRKPKLSASAINAHGDVLDILVQLRRNARAAKCFTKRLIAQLGDPHVVMTDKLLSQGEDSVYLRLDAKAMVANAIRGTQVVEGERRAFNRVDHVRLCH